MILIFESREQFLKLANLSSQDLQTITDNVLSSIEKHYKGGLVKNQKSILNDLRKVSKLIDKYTDHSHKYNEFVKSDNKLLQVINNRINKFLKSQGIKVDPLPSLKTYEHSDKGNKLDGFDVYAKIIKQVVDKISTFIYNQTALTPISKKLPNILNRMLEFNNGWSVIGDVNVQQQSTIRDILNKMLEFNVDIIDIPDNDEQIKNVLNSMLNNNSDGDGDGDDADFTSQNKFTFKCIRRNDPALSDKQYRYDIYVPVDGVYKQQLKEKLGIEYFALQYTIMEPSQIERVMRSPLNTNKLMNAQNCQFCAFNEQNTPMYEFRSWNCHIERGDDKNNFKLINGAIPNLSSPEREYSKEQFISIAKNYINGELINQAPSMKQCVDILLGVIFDDLSNKQINNITYANMLTQQLATDDKSFITPLRDIINLAITSILPNIISKQQSNRTANNATNNSVNK